MSQPVWTNNWASYHFQTWHKVLEKFKGKETHALEIGSMEGQSACFFAHSILTHEDSTITCVDPFVISSQETFWSNVDAIGCRSKINLWAKESDTAPLDYKLWDFVYVDGLHDSPAVMKDACRSWVALKKGGIMIFDDYMWHINDLPRVDAPKLAIDSFLLIFEKELKVLHHSGQVIVEKR